VTYRQPRLSEVATLARVSTATASLALNGGPVADATRARVIGAAEQLRYVARSHARALKTGRTGILGLWVINRPGTVELTEDSGFFYRILRGALGAAERARRTVSFDLRLADLSVVGDALTDVAAQGMHGAVIIVPSGPTTVAAPLRCGPGASRW
jgi:DNA-binding LacI/PurR family transcriptional regulator